MVLLDGEIMKLFVKQEVINKLRQRNKFRRELAKIIRYYQSYPYDFFEKIYGIKLHWYQKVILKFMNNSKIISILSKCPLRSKMRNYML